MGDFKVHQVRFFDFVPWSVQCMAYSKTVNKLAISRTARRDVADEEKEDELPESVEEMAAGSIEIWSIGDNWFQERVFPPVSSVEALQWCGERLFSAGMDGFLNEHDSETGNVKNSVSSNNNAIWCLTVNKSQSFIAAGTEAGCVVLFEIFTDGIEYTRAFSNLGERILSIAWHDAENVIVTGGVDNIRVWSVHSGQAISRLDPGRISNNVETFIYTLCVTDDFTIISGDSRGYTCFWDGHHGTLVKSFRAHQGPVFAMCLTDEGRKVLTSGADPTIIQFQLTSGDPDTDDTNSSWVMSTARVKQSHDVRSLIATGEFIISAGIDGRLIVYNVTKGRTIANAPIIVSPMPQRPIVHTAVDANSLLLQYPRRLELWRLGSTSQTSDKSDAILPLEIEPSCVVSLSLRDGHFSRCSAVSPCGRWIVYSDQDSLRLFHLALPLDGENETSEPVVSRVRCGSGATTADCLQFTPDSSRLIIATQEGVINVWKLDVQHPSLVKVLDPPTAGSRPVLSFTVSDTGRYLAVCDLHRHVHVYNLKKLKYLCTLPTRSCHSTAVAFHPTSPLIFVAYADKMLMEFNISELEYTTWSQQFNEHTPSSWTRRSNKIRRVFYHPRQPDQVYLYDDEMFCIINKTQPLPPKSIKLFSSPFPDKKRKKHGVHALHVCEKFKYVMHVDVLNDDSLVVVEQPLDAIIRSLPPPLHRKKFGI